MADKNIGYGYSLSVDLGSGRALVFQGNFEVGATAEHMNAEVDKLLSVGGRQQAKAMIPQIKEQITAAEATVAAFTQDMADINTRGDKPKLMASPEDVALHNKKQAERTLDHHKRNLDRLRADLAEAEAQAV